MTDNNRTPLFRWLTMGCGTLLVFGFVGFSCMTTAVAALSDNLQLANGQIGRPFVEVHQQGNRISTDKLVSIRLSGAILENDSNALYGQGIASELMEMLEAAIEDTTVKGILVSLDSPGGSVTDSDLLLHQVKKLAASKPVIFLMDDICASGCVYTAIGATEVWALPTTVTGSIGVVIQGINVHEFLSRHGIRDRSITSGEHKAMMSPTRPENKESTQIMQTIVNEMYDRFVTLVSEERKLPPDDVRTFADGRLLTAKQAKEVGLIDSIGRQDEALARLRVLANVTDDIQVVRYIRQPTFYDFLQQMVPPKPVEAAVVKQLLLGPKVMLMPPSPGLH